MVDIGAANYPVLDAVSACEQHTAQLKGCDVTTLAGNERHHQSSASPGGQATSTLNSCSVILRRCFFPPWHDSDFDPACTQLVYHQVVRSIKTGAYRYQTVSTK